MKPFFAVFFSTSVLFLLIEGFSFVFYKPDMSDDLYSLLERDQNLLWKNRPGYRGTFLGEEVTINTDGSRKTGLEDFVSDFVVLVFGGSPSFGLGVNDQITFSSILQRKLGKVTVVNWSVPGFSSEQGLRAIGMLTKKYRPKIVVLSFLVNDIDFTRFFYPQPIEDREVRPQSASLSRIIGFIERRYSYRWISQAIRKINGRVNVKEADSSRVPLNDYIENLREMALAAKELGSEVLLLHIPVYFPTEKIQKETVILKTLNRRSIEYSEEMFRVLEKEIDILDPLKGVNVGMYKNFFLFEKGDHIHLNRKGHDLIADELMKFITSKKLL